MSDLLNQNFQERAESAVEEIENNKPSYHLLLLPCILNHFTIHCL